MSTDPSNRGESPRRAHYDPAFRGAVDAGHLTAGQAYARGNRQVYSNRLIRRHGLSEEAAFAVADNRKTLSDAIHEKAQQAQFSFTPRDEPSGRGLIWMIAIGFAVALAGAGWQLWIAAPGESSNDSPSVRREGNLVLNASGQLLRVIGTSPDAVLESYCSGRPGREFESAGLMRASSESAQVRIGLIRDAGSDDGMFAIPIRHDPSSGRWFTGDGLRPIVAKKAPPGAFPAVHRN